MMAAPRVEHLNLELLLGCNAEPCPTYSAAEVRRETLCVAMRDGTRLATDLYLPPAVPAPAIIVRTPYGRGAMWPDVCMTFARRGYVAVVQDCRGTGDSEPDSWDYYVYEREDSYDLVDWVVKQFWFQGFVASCGGSYVAEVQWCMSHHPAMSAIAPEVGGLGIGFHTARHHMFMNAYARSVGKGTDKVGVSYQDLEREMLQETLAGGYFNEPLHQPFSDALLERYPQLRSLPPLPAKRWLWEKYSMLGPAQRADLIKRALGASTVTIAELESLPAVFGHRIAHDAHMFPNGSQTQLCKALHAAPLMITGWYDWGLNDALATWSLLMEEARDPVRSGARLIITPNAHGGPGYHEGDGDHPELRRSYRTAGIVELLLHWYEAIRGDGLNAWPKVTYYLMGANQWRTAPAWPPPDAECVVLHLHSGGLLAPRPAPHSAPDQYVYDPEDPTPTLGGSIVSSVYAPGSVDVSALHRRRDVLTYSTEPLGQALDVVGPVRLIVFASSSAIDTDFCARLSDVFPDGRAIQLQACVLRTRYRNRNGEPEFLEPGRVYRLEIDLWATANRFEAGHRLRIDISSADFPKFDRNTNRGGEPGDPLRALQTIHHDPEHASHLVLSVMGGAAAQANLAACGESRAPRAGESIGNV